MEAGGEKARRDPSSKRGESDWTTEMMDDTAASNTHLSSGIINSKRDDQHTWRILPQLCYAGVGAVTTEGRRWMSLFVGGLAEVTGAQELREYSLRRLQ